MGTTIKHLSQRVSLITSDRLWIESAAVQQLNTTAELPHIARAVGLPDLHPGRGYPVGAAFFSIDHFYPALVGNDIGCGMALWQTSLPIAKLKLDKLDKQWGTIDNAISEDEWAVLTEIDPSWPERIQVLTDTMRMAGLDTAHLRSLGTIGGGNHFAELQMIDSVNDPESFAQTGLQPKQLQLLVHSGSRGLGQTILRAHVDAFSHHGLADGSPAALAYLQQHNSALQFADCNRNLIAQRIMQRLRCTGELILDVHHNTVTPAVLEQERGWLHRKGASPSNQSLIMLPGSRGDYSYLLQPITNSCEISLNSLAHGAGRKWQRTDCKDRLYKLANPEQLSRTALSSRVICKDRALIYEEAPQAYKSVDSVLECLLGAGLVQVIAKSKPVLTYKIRGECC